MGDDERLVGQQAGEPWRQVEVASIEDWPSVARRAETERRQAVEEELADGAVRVIRDLAVQRVCESAQSEPRSKPHVGQTREQQRVGCERPQIDVAVGREM